MSGFKYYVKTGAGSEWSTNACVFATHAEAKNAAVELSGRWLLVTAYEVRPTQDAVNYTFQDGRPRSLESVNRETV